MNDYLVRKKLSKQQAKGKRPIVAHLWDGSDTLCRLWSTGGIRRKSAYKVADAPGKAQICMMCAENASPHMDRVWRAAVEAEKDPPAQGFLQVGMEEAKGERATPPLSAPLGHTRSCPRCRRFGNDELNPAKHDPEDCPEKPTLTLADAKATVETLKANPLEAQEYYDLTTCEPCTCRAREKGLTAPHAPTCMKRVQEERMAARELLQVGAVVRGNRLVPVMALVGAEEHTHVHRDGSATVTRSAPGSLEEIFVRHIEAGERKAPDRSTACGPTDGGGFSDEAIEAMRNSYRAGYRNGLRRAEALTQRARVTGAGAISRESLVRLLKKAKPDV